MHQAEEVIRQREVVEGRANSVSAMEEDLKKLKSDIQKKQQAILEEEQRIRMKISDANDHANKVKNAEDSLMQRIEHQKTKEERTKNLQQASIAAEKAAHMKELEYSRMIEALEKEQRLLKVAQNKLQKERAATKEESEGLKSSAEKIKEKDREITEKQAECKRVENQANENFLQAQRKLDSTERKEAALEDKEASLSKREEAAKANIAQLREEANGLLVKARAMQRGAESKMQNVKQSELKLEDKKIAVGHLADKAREREDRAQAIEESAAQKISNSEQQASAAQVVLAEAESKDKAAAQLMVKAKEEFQRSEKLKKEVQLEHEQIQEHEAHILRTRR